MRIIILLSGAGLLAIAIALLLFTEGLAVFTIPVSAIVIILGLIISHPTRITSGNGQPGSPPMVVDRGILGTSIYQIFFFETRLILKRIATAKTTVFSIAILAVAGLVLDRLIGALAGVAAGYAIQEFTSQNNRLKSTVNNSSFKLGIGDIEVPYDNLEKVQIDKNKLVLFSKRGITKISMPRGYGAEVSPRLAPLFPGKFKKAGSVHSPDASRKQDK